MGNLFAKWSKEPETPAADFPPPAAAMNQTVRMRKRANWGGAAPNRAGGMAAGDFPPENVERDRFRVDLPGTTDPETGEEFPARTVTMLRRSLPTSYEQHLKNWTLGGLYFNTPPKPPSFDGGIGYHLSDQAAVMVGDASYATPITVVAAQLGIFLVELFDPQRYTPSKRTQIVQDYGLTPIGAGSFNKFLSIDANATKPDLYNALVQIVTSTGYDPASMQLGVRVSVQPLRGTLMTDQENPLNFVHGYDEVLRGAFGELFLMLMMGSLGLGPKVLGCVVLNQQSSRGEAQSIRSMSILQRTRMGLNDFIWDEIVNKWTDDVEGADMCVALGEEIVRVVDASSRAGLLMLDIKTPNMLYDGVQDPTTGRWQHKVYMTDFDSMFTVLFPKEQDHDCIEVLNLLALLHFMQCSYDLPLPNAPITGSVMDPMRARLRFLAGRLDIAPPEFLSGEKAADVKLYPGMGIRNSRFDDPKAKEVLSSKLCNFMMYPMVAGDDYDDFGKPLWRTDPFAEGMPDARSIKDVAHLFTERIRHYSWGFTTERERVDRGCYPYLENRSLMLQMYQHLKGFRRNRTRTNPRGRVSTDQRREAHASMGPGWRNHPDFPADQARRDNGPHAENDELDAHANVPVYEAGPAGPVERGSQPGPSALPSVPESVLSSMGTLPGLWNQAPTSARADVLKNCAQSGAPTVDAVFARRM